MTSKFARLLARSPTYFTYIRERPRWLWVLLGGRILVLRRLERFLNGAKPQKVIAGLNSRLLVDRPEEVIEDLLRHGVSRRISLSPSDVAAIHTFAVTRECISRSTPVKSFLPANLAQANAERSSDIIAAYYFEQVRECAEITAIENDPLIRSLAKAYVGSDPYHIRTRLWWSFPGRRVEDADLHAAAQDRYHFDLNDFRTLKFFFYITAVDEENGAHVFISGSHRRRKLGYQFSFLVGHDEDSLRKFYGSENFIMITGSAGSGFVEDPFVFHVGMTCRTRPRLLLEIEFGPYIASESYRYGILG